MIGYLNLILRLAIWFLLTADFSWPNITIGIFISLVLPQSYSSYKHPGAIKDWSTALWESIVAIPQAYIEALQIIISPHNGEEIVMEQVRPNRTPGLIFLDIFVITFTPKTIVLKYHQEGQYEAHHVRRRQKS